MRSSRNSSITVVHNVFRSILVLSIILMLSACGGGGGGGGGATDFAGPSEVAGRALAPEAGATGGDGADSQRNLVPVPNGAVTTIDFIGGRGSRTTQVGETDADGNNSVTLAEGGGAIVVVGQVNGSTVRISGLLRQSGSSSQKDFDPATDVACQAFFSAFNTSELEAEALTQNRIDNLENAARSYLNSNKVDFFDPAQVTVAALAVRAATNNGEFAADGFPAASDSTTDHDNTTADAGTATAQ